MKEFMKMFNFMNKDDFKSDGPNSSPFSDSMFDMKNFQDYIQKSIEDALKPTQNMFPNSFGALNQKSEGLDYEVVELMKYYIIKINLPPDVDIASLRFTLGNCKLFVEGLEGGRKTIQLPGQPSRRKVAAQYKDGMVEIRLQKKRDDYEKEIFVYY